MRTCNVNKKKITPIQARLFIGAFLAVFVLSSFHYLGVTLTSFVSPVPQEDVMDTIKPKLAEKTNTFSLRKARTFIPKASAEEIGTYESAKAYVVIDYDTGDIIMEKNLSKQLPIASLTKVMTGVVALDLVSPEKEFVITPRAASIEPTKIGVIPGQKMTMGELLEASLLTSANDAVEVIREGVDGVYHEPVFIQAMNQKAKYVGLKNTHFSNPQGFDSPENYSTAEDMAILARYALTQYPYLAEIVGKEYAYLPENKNHKQFDLYNWNGLLDVYPNVSGVKIGNTDDAGMTTVVVSERSGKKLLVVLLGAPGILERDLWTAELFDLGFSKLLGLQAVAVTKEQLQEKYSTWNYWN